MGIYICLVLLPLPSASNSFTICFSVCLTDYSCAWLMRPYIWSTETVMLVSPTTEHVWSGSPDGIRKPRWNTEIMTAYLLEYQAYRRWAAGEVLYSLPQSASARIW
jgi:hypothetical protein